MSKTIKLTVNLLNDEKDPIGGKILLWTEGAHVVTVIDFEYWAAGNVHSMPYPDPMEGKSLLEYYLNNWHDRESGYVDSIDVSEFN